MMPGIRSLGRIGASPGLESASALRPARPTVVDLRRQQSQQTQHQHQPHFPFHTLQAQQPSSSTHRVETVMGLPHLLVTKQSQEGAVAQGYQVNASSAQSRHSGSSSGSEYEPSSDYLQGLVSNFMDVDTPHHSVPPPPPHSTSMEREREREREREVDSDESPSALSDLASSVQSLSACSSALESRLLSDVLCALQLARSTLALQADLMGDPPPSSPDPTPSNGPSTSTGTSTSTSSMRRAVMGRLRAAGYNAAVCKSRWDHSRGIPGGDHEYLDVVFSSPDTTATQRLVVDLDFRAQFQVARPSAAFQAALLATPVVFVGREERLTQLVEVLADACRRSLKAQGMHLPPWRKSEYLRAKWLSPYKRTTNLQVSAPGADSKAVVPAVAPSGVHVPLSFARWRDQDQFMAAAALRPCQPVRRPSTAPRGVLGLLLQEQVLNASPVS